MACTPKELLYIEDVLSNEQQSQQLCSDLVNQLQDQQLQTLVQSILSKNQECYSKFFSLLNQ